MRLDLCNREVTEVRRNLDGLMSLFESRLAEEAERLQRQLSYQGVLGDLVGTSPSMQKVFSLIRQVAPSKAAVFVTGESGTGKELVARAVHQLSPRAAGPFVAINCAALPETLMESELFGHEKGAFTGAVSRRAGMFERAHLGTIFLDEVGETSPKMQTRLLRVLESGDILRVGGVEMLRVDVRVIAATNKKLAEAVRAGSFRQDLYYRLKGINLFLPPLRDRREDIPTLIQHFISLSGSDKILLNPIYKDVRYVL